MIRENFKKKSEIFFIGIGYISLIFFNIYLYILSFSALNLFFKFRKIYLEKIQIITVIIFCLILFVYLFQCVDVNNIIISIKYYFGFCIFYVLFLTIKKDISAYYSYNIFYIITIIEIILINQNYFSSGLNEIRSVIEISNPSMVPKLFDFYNKPLGITTNPTMSSTLGLILFEYIQKDNKIFKSSKTFQFSGLLIPFLYFSGTALLLYLIIIIKNNIKKAPIVILLSVIIFYLMQELIKNYYPKLSIESLNELIIIKYNGIRYNLDFKSWKSLIFGNVAIYGFYPLIFDDFGWINLISDMGLFGALTFCIIVFINIKKRDLFILFLIFIACLHYPMIFTNIGNLLFALILQSKLNSR